VIEIIRDRISLDNLKGEWNNLSKKFDSPILSHEWIATCAKVFYKEKDLHIIVIRSNGKINGIAPMAVCKKKGIEHLEFLGSSSLYEPCNLIYENNESLTDLLKNLTQLRIPIFFNRIPHNLHALSILSDFLRSKGIFIRRKSSGCAFLPITTSWKDYKNIFSSKRRYDFRRKRRMAEKIGRVEFKIFCPSMDKLSTNLTTAFKVESAGWKGRKGSALLTNKRLREFFEIYASLTCAEEILRLCFLYIDDFAVAMVIGLEYQKKFWLLKNGFDEKWKRCSPGIQLIHETVKYAFDRGLESYEFLGSDEPYVHIWAKNNFRKYASIGFYPRSLSGIIGFGLDAGNFIYRKLR
jgi:CelD/BcsL family acetyltransferase involved in cellulose biosynthesis